MDRNTEIKKHLSKHLASGARGLEIAPWHSPILPKALYPSVLTLDVFSHDELLAHARRESPPIPEEKIAAIEAPDFVGNAAELAAAIPNSLHGKLKFIVSSHNFEHIPNPVRFLADCSKLLADDGVLVMAIPDKRGCFDHWRPVSSLGQLIEAYIEGRLQPTLAQRIDNDLGNAYIPSPDGPVTAFFTQTPESRIWSDESRFDELANQLRHISPKGANDDSYVSVHCWTFTPESFALLIRDLSALKLVGLHPIEITEPIGAEFVVHMSKTAFAYPPRTAMCRQLATSLSSAIPAPDSDPRRYRRLFAAYMGILRILDRLLLKPRDQ